MKYTGEYTNEISFPIGAIGSGSIGLAGNGSLVDWEIFNRPSKGSFNGYSHFAVKAIAENEKPITYILNGDLNKEYIGRYSKERFDGYGFGPRSQTMCGFPHFKNVEFNGEFPIATLNFSDDKFPAFVKMTAFNPFIPCDAKNSSIPAGFFEIEFENTSDKTIEYQVAFSVANPYEVSKNASDVTDGITTLRLYNGGVDISDKNYGEITIATDCKSSNIQEYWYRGTWQDGIITFWNDFSSLSPLKNRKYSDCGKYDTGTISTSITVKPKEKASVRFVISWNVPNNYNYWSEYKDDNGNDVTWKNYYATIFENSDASAVYSLKNWNSLYNRTMKFKNILHSSTLPKEVIDAAVSNLSVLKSPTVLRLEDGTFYGWEGVHELEGSCEGTCQHVWNYAYALCFLFPELERSVRDAEFKYATNEIGKTSFRQTLPLGREMNDIRACLDGQMGCVIKSYREWILSGDDEWLKSNWNNIKKVLEYAWSEENPDKWDYDKDGVLEGRQHHTLDSELFGPSSWLEGMYLLALKAASVMADYLGDSEKAEEYKTLYEKGRKWTKENLFNGKYFIQKVDLTDKNTVAKFNACEQYWNDETSEIKYQIGNGSSIDQMLAQWHSDLLGLGDIFDKEQTDTALSEMMKNNFKSSMRDFTNTWRIFSLNDESGSVICVYPDGFDKPKIPIPYCEETMTGFEYSFAGLLCSRGKFDDGFKVVKAIRDRFDGKKRNPYNEFECGSNYARSMASYALIPILSGFKFDLPHKHIGFKPYKSGYFKTVWSVNGVWGEIEIDDSHISLTVAEGSISLKSFGIDFCKRAKSVKVDNEDVKFEFKNGTVFFDERKITNCLEVEI